MLTTVRFEDDTLTILDQTRLPSQVAYETLDFAEQVFDAIASLKVRGAPLIGVVAAYGVLVGIREQRESPLLLQEVASVCRYLEGARPTAVNLKWALDRMLAKAQSVEDATQRVPIKDATQCVQDPLALYEALVEEARRIHAEDTEINRNIGKQMYSLIKDKVGAGSVTFMTHCNAGALATTGFGTATSVMYLLNSMGIKVKVYACETRPLLQGARLTALELSEAGIETVLITDNMAASVLSQGLVDVVIVGADRVAANHDVANKVGTLGLSIIAGHYHVPFYVACPSPTYDAKTATGADIVIEERDGAEITSLGGVCIAPEGITPFNPAFDVTPAENITAIVTEDGVLQ